MLSLYVPQIKLLCSSFAFLPCQQVQMKPHAVWYRSFRKSSAQNAQLKEDE